MRKGKFGLAKYLQLATAQWPAGKSDSTVQLVPIVAGHSLVGSALRDPLIGNLAGYFRLDSSKKDAQASPCETKAFDTAMHDHSQYVVCCLCAWQPPFNVR